MPADLAPPADRDENRAHGDIGMQQFLRENWLYIVAPLVLVLIGLGLLALFSDDKSSPFIYNIF